MRVWVIARNTLASFLRNKILIAFVLAFGCILLFMLASLTAVRSMRTAGSFQQGREMALAMISGAMSLVSGFGSLLAAWSAADALGSELKSGTVLAIIARPIQRWEFLLGKYLGVEMLLGIYVVCSSLFAYILAWSVGEQIYSTPWVMIVYPLVRYSVYSAIGLLLATFLPVAVAIGGTFFISVLTNSLGAIHRVAPEWVWASLHAVLPSTNLLTETQFLVLSASPLEPASLSRHLISLGHGLDYSLALFLLAVWVFHRRNLVGE
jgi:ABC-type transport system involved in multi-copper enzyme maturation permease subunit